jgi:hypothetical protein
MGTRWTTVQPVPIDPVGSGVDHFTAGIAVDKNTAGAQAHLALAFYYFPNTNCTNATCQLDAGYVSSVDGGSSWSANAQLAGPMTLSWLANTTEGYMTGDYISTSIVGGKAFPAIAVAFAPQGKPLQEAIYTVALSLVGGAVKTRMDAAVVAPHSQRLPTRYLTAD